MDNSNTSGHYRAEEALGEDPFILEGEAGAPGDAGNTHGYARALKAYFLSGRKKTESLQEDLVPLPYARRHAGEGPHTAYPIWYDAENDGFLSFYPLLEDQVKAHFDEVAGAILSRELSSIFTSTLENAAEDDIGIVVQPMVEEIVNALRALDLPDKGTEEWKDAFNALQRDLLGQVTILFGCSPKTAFQVLNLHLLRRGHDRRAFLQTLKKAIAGLQELLLLHGSPTDSSLDQMDFAEDLISFDKIRNLTSAVSSKLPEASLERMRSALHTLTAAQASYSERPFRIVAREEVVASLHLRRIFGDAQITVAAEDPCQLARVRSQQDVEALVRTVAALRMGERMIESTFDEELHGDYFDRFQTADLAAEDIRFLPPTLVIEQARQITQQYDAFLSLLSKSSFVKVVAYNHLDELYAPDGQDEAERLELASLALFRRNSYVFQGGMDRPADLYRSFKRGLALPESAFWNLLIPSPETEGDRSGRAGLRAAVESRYFPRVEYTGEDHDFPAARIDLSHNPAPDAAMVTYAHQARSSTETQTIEFGHTVAAFLATDPGRRKALEIVPPGYQHPDLIPLQAYLSEPKDRLSGKIPFLWMADAENRLWRAALPFSWVQRCRDRLAYWGFLRSLAGASSPGHQEGIEAEKTAWEKAKAEEIASVRSALRAQYESERADFLEQAIFRMVYGLLGEEGGMEKALTEISRKDHTPPPATGEGGEDRAAPAGTGESLRATEPAREEVAAPEAPVIAEAWVDSEDCTSCQDCVDALPSVFKYNENRQAYVHDPKGGTFAQIVKAAEKCPARCIHPGVPQNEKEPALEKWIKRAEKFN